MMAKHFIDLAQHRTFTGDVRMGSSRNKQWRPTVPVALQQYMDKINDSNPIELLAHGYVRYTLALSGHARRLYEKTGLRGTHYEFLNDASVRLEAILDYIDLQVTSYDDYKAFSEAAIDSFALSLQLVDDICAQNCLYQVAGGMGSADGFGLDVERANR